MKPFMLFGSSIMIIVILISAVSCINKKNATPEHHLEVVLRNVGHQLLITAKDSTSRVLPVKKLHENTYQLSFQNKVGFISDTLINLFEREFQKIALSEDFIVNLRNCDAKETVLAFEVNSKTGNITPCRGLMLPVDCYFIEVHLLKPDPYNYYLLLLLMIPLGLVGFYVQNKFRKKEETVFMPENNDYIQLGKFRLYTANNVLKMEDNNIALSEKETKALKIFAENINQVVDREKLMKEIWEDKGVVVISRNVDVLVSKLRKKLSDDSSIKFINVHGRGYKFVIE